MLISKDRWFIALGLYPMFSDKPEESVFIVAKAS
jgi:hypothetical protein